MENEEKDILFKMGFEYICDFMVRPDGTLCADAGISGTYEIDWELWIDYKKKRVVLYNPKNDLNFLEGEFTNKEEKKWYGEK